MRYHSSLKFVAVLLCACGPASAPQEAYQTEATEAPTTETTEPPVTEETAPPAEPLDLSSVQAYIDTVAEKYGAIGVQVAVINDGEIADSFACGWATVEEDPMTEDHKIRAQSAREKSSPNALPMARPNAVSSR